MEVLLDGSDLSNTVMKSLRLKLEKYINKELKSKLYGDIEDCNLEVKKDESSIVLDYFTYTNKE